MRTSTTATTRPAFLGLATGASRGSIFRKASPAGYRLVDDAPLLWSAFEQLHHKYGLPGQLEIPMESFTRAVEIVLKESELRDAAGFRPEAPMWNVAVRSCGYIQSRQAVSQELKTALLA